MSKLIKLHPIMLAMMLALLQTALGYADPLAGDEGQPTESAVVPLELATAPDPVVQWVQQQAAVVAAVEAPLKPPAEVPPVVEEGSDDVIYPDPDEVELVEEGSDDVIYPNSAEIAKTVEPPTADLSFGSQLNVPGQLFQPGSRTQGGSD